MTEEVWLKGMGDLVLALEKRTVSPEEAAARGDLYRRVLGGLTDEEFLRAVAMAIQHEEFFPPPATLLRYAQPAPPPAADAGEVFQAIVDRYFHGEHMDSRAVLERWGPAARSAFVAAGGKAAFESCGSEQNAQWVRKTFISVWSEHLQDDPRAGLPAGDKPREITDGEARQILGSDGGFTKNLDEPA